MTTLVLGATGATGRLLVKQLLDRGHNVRAIVRSPDKLSTVLNHRGLSLTRASLLDLSDAELSGHVEGCDAIASCLGHTLSLRGMYGSPRRLVTDATRRLCEAVKRSKAEGRTKFVLMNTAGNNNRDLEEPISAGQRFLIGLLRLLVPPHVDNEHAADYLRVDVGQSDEMIEWVAVRPDTLVDEDEATQYELHASPRRSALFDPGRTSRINVAHFMAELICDEPTWIRWRGQMPVIYNVESD